MRRLASVSTEWDASAARPMPKPFKLAAYVDPFEKARTPASALVSVLSVAFGMAAGGAYLAPPVLPGGSIMDGASAKVEPAPLRHWPQPTIARDALPAFAGIHAQADISLHTTAPLVARDVPAARPTRAPAAVKRALRPVEVAPVASAQGDGPGRPMAGPAVSSLPASAEPEGSNLARVAAQQMAPDAFARPGALDTAATPSQAIATIASASASDAKAAILPVDAPERGEQWDVAVSPSAGAASQEAETQASDARSSAPKQTARGVEFEVGARFNGVTAGRISLLLEGGTLGRTDRVSDNISVRIGDIIALLGPRMDPALRDWLGSSSHAAQYLTLNDLRGHGIGVSFDAKDRLVFTAM